MENVKNYLINLKEHFEGKNSFYYFFERKYWIEREKFLRILDDRITAKTIRKLKTCWIEWNKIQLEELDKKEKEKIDGKRWPYKKEKKVYNVIDKFKLEDIKEPNLALKKDILDYRKDNPKFKLTMPTRSLVRILRNDKIGIMAVNSLLQLDFWGNESILILKKIKAELEKEKKEYNKNYIFSKPEEQPKVKGYLEIVEDWLKRDYKNWKITLEQYRRQLDYARECYKRRNWKSYDF